MSRGLSVCVAHDSRMLTSVSSRSGTFLLSLRPFFAKSKIVSAQRRNQHARRVRSPIQLATP